MDIRRILYLFWVSLSILSASACTAAGGSSPITLDPVQAVQTNASTTSTSDLAADQGTVEPRTSEMPKGQVSASPEAQPIDNQPDPGQASRTTTPEAAVVFSTPSPTITPANPQGLLTLNTLGYPLYVHPTPASRQPTVSPLIYRTEDRLLRWNQLTGQAELLATGVSEYIAATGGSSLVYLKLLPMTANGLQRYDLANLDLNTLQVSILITQTSALLNPALSPDGRWLAYSLEVENNPIYLLEVIPGHRADPIRLSDCIPASPQQCSHYAWSPDSQSLAWTDRSGIWISGTGPGTAHLRHEPFTEIMDPAGETNQLPVQFSSPEWSPVGRFINGFLVCTAGLAYGAAS